MAWPRGIPLAAAALCVVLCGRAAWGQGSPDSGSTFYNASTFRDWPFPGDANRDGVIDETDLIKVNADLGQTGMMFIPNVVGRGGPNMDGPVGDGIFGFLWSDFNHDGVVDAADVAVVTAALATRTSGAYALNVDGSVAMGGTEYGQALVFPEGPIDFSTWNGVYWPFNRQPQRVLLTHLGIYDPETGVRTGPNTDPALPGVYVLTGKYLETIAAPINSPPDYTPFGRFSSTNNDFRIDYTGAGNGLPRQSLAWASEAMLYHFATDYRRRFLNDEFVDSMGLAQSYAINLKNRQYRPGLIDDDPVNDVRLAKPIVFAAENVPPLGIALYSVPNSAAVGHRTIVGSHAGDPPLSFAFEPDAWVGDYPALIATCFWSQDWEFPSEVLFGETSGWTTNVLPALSDGWSDWVAYRYRPQSDARVYRWAFVAGSNWAVQPCGSIGLAACNLGQTARNIMMFNEADTSRSGVFPYSWPYPGAAIDAEGAGLASFFFAAVSYDVARDAGLGDFRTDLLWWKTVALLDNNDHSSFPMRQFGVRCQQAARLLWPDPAHPGQSIYEQDIADVLTSRGVPINGVADFRTLLPPAIGPVIPASSANFASNHPTSQPADYNSANAMIVTYATPGPSVAYVSYQLYKHSKYGPCDRLRFTDGTFTIGTDDVYNNDGTMVVSMHDRQLGNLSVFVPGNTVTADLWRARCQSEGTIDAAGLSGAYWEDVKPFGFIVTKATPNGFSVRVTRLGDVLSADRRSDRVRYRLDIEDPSLSLPSPLGRNASYAWTFTEFDGASVARNGRQVVYAAMKDQPFTMSITRTRPPVNAGDPVRTDTLTLRERGTDLDRPGIAPGSGGGDAMTTGFEFAAGAGTIATAPGYALVYNGTTLTTPPYCIADFDDNGILGVQDIFAYLNAWFGGDPRADIDDNGLSVQDIFTFLNTWFSGC